MPTKMRTVLHATESFLSEAIRSAGIINSETILSFYNRPSLIKTKNEFFEKLVGHSYNRYNLPKVIGVPIEKNKSQFRDCMFDYDPKKVVQMWGDKPSSHLLESLRLAKIAPSPKGGVPSRSWESFARSIIDAAIFVNDIEDFENFVIEAGRNEYSSLGAITFVKGCIHGYGDALAADVLKECGIIDSVKPDTHIWKLERLLNLGCHNDLDLLIKLNGACRRDGVSPYQLDKRVWLVYAQNRFYDHKTLKLKIDTKKYEKMIKSLF